MKLPYIWSALALSTLLLWNLSPTVIQASPQSDISELNTAFQQNALSANKNYKGKTVNFVLFIESVDERAGTPYLFTNIQYSDGTYIACQVHLNAASTKTAMNLKAGDKVEINGIFENREVKYRDEVESQGYTVRTVTRSWSVFYINKGSVKLVKSAVDMKRDADQKVQDILNSGRLWNKATLAMDMTLARKALDDSINIRINSEMDEIASAYGSGVGPWGGKTDNIVDFYLWCYKQPETDQGTAVDHLFFYVPNADFLRKIYEKNFFKFFEADFTIPSGDTVLSYFLKGQPYIGYNYIDERPIKQYFNSKEADVIEFFCSLPFAKTLVNKKNKYDKSAKDYINENPGSHRYKDKDSPESKAFDRIQNAINAVK